MQWVIDNWILLVFGGAMVAMHLFGHRGHGGHAGQDKNRNPDRDGSTDKEPQDDPEGKMSTTVIPKAGPKAGKPLKPAPNNPKFKEESDDR